MILTNIIDKRKIAHNFSIAARVYDDHANLQQFVANNLLRNLLRHIKHATDTGMILDAGCGTGYLSRLLPGADIIGLDIAAGMCAISKENGQYAIAADMENMPFAANSFRGIFSSLAMQWLPNYESFLAQAHHCTKRGGWLALATLLRGTLHELEQAYHDIGLPANILQFITKEELYSKLVDSGWHIESCIVEPQTTQHGNLFALLKYMKALGASGSMRILRHRGDLLNLEKLYPKASTTKAAHDMINASWNIIYLVARKV